MRIGVKWGCQMSLDIAIAASARDWPDRLHRHVLDHGGARVVGRLMGASQCIDTEFDVVFIDDVCSFLSPRLVTKLRQKERLVVGVFDPADSPDAKRRLLECGISDVIESDAAPEEFVVRAVGAASDLHPVPVVDESPRVLGRSFAVVGVTEGVGATEVAVGLATSASRTAAVTLLDLDPAWPSVAQRLDLAPHPNLRTLIDVTLHGGDLDGAVQPVGALKVGGGSVNGNGTGQPMPHEVTMVLDALAERCDVLVADLGAEERVSGVLLESFEAVILLSGSDPVSLTRMFRSRERLAQIAERTGVLVAINRVPRRRFHRAEIRAEVSSVLGEAPFVLLPLDESLPESAWEGNPVTSGPFIKEVSRISDLMVGAVSR